MREFKISARTFPTPRHDSRIMLLVSAAALALSFGILFFIGYAPGSLVHRLGPPLVWVLVLVILCTLATYILMLRRKWERVRHDLSYALDKDELTCKMPGRPDVQIALQQIQSLYEQSGYLVVTGGDPARRIAVPRKVEDFELLRTELLRYAPLSSPPWSYRLKVGWVTLLLYIICWVLLLWSGDAHTIRLAAVGVVVLLGWDSFILHQRMPRGRARITLWVALGSSWLLTAGVIYIRAFGGRL